MARANRTVTYLGKPDDKVSGIMILGFSAWEVGEDRIVDGDTAAEIDAKFNDPYPDPLFKLSPAPKGASPTADAPVSVDTSITTQPAQDPAKE